MAGDERSEDREGGALNEIEKMKSLLAKASSQVKESQESYKPSMPRTPNSLELRHCSIKGYFNISNEIILLKN